MKAWNFSKNLIDNFQEDPVEALDIIKKTYPQKYNNYPTFNSLTSNTNDDSDVITARAGKFMEKGQLQRDIINLILDVTNQRKKFNQINDEEKTSWDNFVKACSKLFDKTNQNQENKPAEQQEEDTWINDKLNHFRTQGII